MKNNQPNKTVFYALAANAGIAFSKGVATFLTGSGAMLAETIHSCADCANQLLLLVGHKQSQQLPNDDHPMGYGKSVFVYAFLVSLLLFAFGGVFAMYEGVTKIFHPEPIDHPWVAVAVLMVSVVLEGLSFWGCLREIRAENDIDPGLKSLWKFYRESRNSELIVVLAEDTAALIGLAVAFLSVVMTLITGNPLFDAVGSFLVGLILVIIAGTLFSEVRALLIGQSADPKTHEAIAAVITDHDAVSELFNLITLQFGSKVMVAVKARMKAGSASDLVADINRCEATLRAKFPEIGWIFFEPDTVP